MRIKDIEGVTLFDAPFLSTTATVWALPPVPRTAPDYNERVYELRQRIFEARPEGCDQVTVIFPPE